MTGPRWSLRLGMAGASQANLLARFPARTTMTGCIPTMPAIGIALAGFKFSIGLGHRFAGYCFPVFLLFLSVFGPTHRAKLGCGFAHDGFRDFDLLRH